MDEDEEENVDVDTVSEKTQGETSDLEETHEPVLLSADQLDQAEELKSFISDAHEPVLLSADQLDQAEEPKSIISDEPNKSTTTIASAESKKVFEASDKYRKPISYSDEPEVQRIVQFLRSKDLSENLIGRILKNGLGHGFDRLLRALGITNDQIEQFEWKKRFDSNDFAYDSPRAQVADSGQSAMNPDDLYLKKHFGDTLVRAVKEIIKLKPRDPVDFLGNWLINSQVCEERKNKFTELEAELNRQKQSSKDPDMEMETKVIGYDGTHKSIENDSNDGEYDQPE